MKLSGTNSVKPPVRSCSSRTTRMCSASSQGSSICPNITVTVVRTPAAWAASMISPQRAGRQAAEYLGERELAGHEVQLHRRVGVEVDLRRLVLRDPQPVLVVLN